MNPIFFLHILKAFLLKFLVLHVNFHEKKFILKFLRFPPFFSLKFSIFDVNKNGHSMLEIH